MLSLVYCGIIYRERDLESVFIFDSAQSVSEHNLKDLARGYISAKVRRAF